MSERSATPHPGSSFDARLSAMRSLIGESARFWCADDGHEVSDGWWKAMSGTAHPGFNVVLCHGADPALAARSTEAVASINAPATIILAGPALALAQALADEGWVCVGAAPLMALGDVAATALDVDERVVQVGPEGLVRAREVVGQTFGLGPDAARVALPDVLLAQPHEGVWALSVDGEIRSCMVAVIVGRTMVCWSMATPPAWQGQGYGRRLLTSVLARHGSQGVTDSLLYASPAGERLYRQVGYEVVEHWQLWSRPRWVLG